MTSTATTFIIILLYIFITAADEIWCHWYITALSVRTNWVKFFSPSVHLRKRTDPGCSNFVFIFEYANLDKLQSRKNARYKHCNLVQLAKEISFFPYTVLRCFALRQIHQPLNLVLRLNSLNFLWQILLFAILNYFIILIIEPYQHQHHHDLHFLCKNTMRRHKHLFCLILSDLTYVSHSCHVCIRSEQNFTPNS